jgi:uncharacterized membrane protein YfhO
MTLEVLHNVTFQSVRISKINVVDIRTCDMLGILHTTGYFLAMVTIIIIVPVIPWLLFATNCARLYSVIVSNNIIWFLFVSFVCLLVFTL